MSTLDDPFVIDVDILFNNVNIGGKNIHKRIIINI